MQFIIFLALPFALLWQDIRLKKVKVSEAITISLPKEFIPMSDQDIAARHISYRRPIGIFTNQERTADLSINTAVSQWPEADLPLMKDFYKASINALFDGVEFLTDEIIEIDGKQFAVLEFISVTEPDENSGQTQGAVRNYTLARYTIVDGQTMVFTFSSPARQKEKWQPIVREVMSSIKIKKASK